MLEVGKKYKVEFEGQNFTSKLLRMETNDDNTPSYLLFENGIEIEGICIKDESKEK